MQRICILGSTGSIGLNTLAVIRRHPDRYQVYALAANVNVDRMLEQCQEFEPAYAVMQDKNAAAHLESLIAGLGLSTKVLAGMSVPGMSAPGKSGLEQVVGLAEVDTVVAAIVGAAGLQPTMAAVEAGKKILLANKEALVMSGSLLTRAARHSGAKILPIDSEHNAIFQCLPTLGQSLEAAGVKKIILTGSGGPFRTRAIDELNTVSADEACAHPNWDMGRKISVDSATMMNKGLEFIEACWLFDARPEQIQIVVHPQSIIHSMVEYLDGSVLAQLGNPDMRTPIAHCLAWPERIESGVEPLDFYRIASLEFSAPDLDRFPCLNLATEAIRLGGTCPAALNAANEVAVAAFLAGDIGFLDIARVIAEVMRNWSLSEPKTLAEVIEADLQAREHANDVLTRTIQL